jgi:hypothetical protein
MGEKNLLEAPHGGQSRGNECRGALNEVGVELGSKLNLVEVAVDTMLGSNNLSSKVIPREELASVENVLKVKD